MRKVKFWQIKPEIRILGIDDGPFEPHGTGKVLLVGTIFRGGRWLDGVLSTHIELDGVNVTDRVIDMVNGSRHKGQLRIIMTDGVTFAGFNVLDIKKVFDGTGLPVVTVSRELPNMRDVKKAIKRLPDWHERWVTIKETGKIYPVRTRRRAEPVYIQFAGIKRTDAEQVVKLSSTHSLIPEPLRVAHLIAAGIVRDGISGEV